MLRWRRRGQESKHKHPSFHDAMRSTYIEDEGVEADDRACCLASVLFARHGSEASLHPQAMAVMSGRDEANLGAYHRRYPSHR